MAFPSQEYEAVTAGRVSRSVEIGALVASLSTAQGVIEGASKDSANPFFKSAYADLASVWDAIRKPLADNGLSVMQLPSADGPRVTITTVLAHSSGQWISSDLTLTAKEDAPQAVGSAITYARRYALQSVVGVAPEDDDGERAQGRQTQTGPRPQPHPLRTAPSPDPDFKKLMVTSFESMLAKFKAIEAEGEFVAVLGANGYTSIGEIPANRGIANEVMNNLKLRLADLSRK